MWRDDGMDVRVLPFTAQNFVRLNPLPQSELDFFQIFFSNEMLLKIVHETNRHVKQKLTGRTLTPRSIRKTWTDITLTMLKTYLDVVMNMAINERGSVQDYFLRDGIKDQRFFRNIFSRDRIHANSLYASCRTPSTFWTDSTDQSQERG